MVLSLLIGIPSFGIAKTVEKDQDFDKKVSSLRMPFIENQGQVGDKHVRYYAKTFGGTLFVTKDGEMVYALPLIEKETKDDGKAIIKADKASKGWALKERLIGSLNVTPMGSDKSQTKISIFKGNDQTKWKSNLPTYNEILLGEVYKGIDLKLRAYGNNAEKIFTVHPGSHPDTIRLSMEGALSLKINKEGQLVAETELGPVQFTAPIAYQLTPNADKREYVQVAYRLVDHGYGFDVTNYDKKRPLVIDPLLASTFIGGSSVDNAYTIALDASGNVYIAGETSSLFYPSGTTAYDTTQNGGSDVFISRLDANLSTLQASTFIGGNSTDICRSMVLDGSNNVYVTGYTTSVTTPYPTTAGVYDQTPNGGDDVFVSILTPTLTTLTASTLIGGGVIDRAFSIAIDGSNNIYITGYTQYTAVAANYPNTFGVFNEIHNGGYDVFVSRLNSTLTTLVASTFVGGGDNEFATSLTLDSSSNVYITGRTNSSSGVTGYPVTVPPGIPYQGTYQGGIFDGFVTRLDANLTATGFVSTFLGGTENDQPFSIALDTSNNVYVTGYTYSDDFPITTGAALSGTYDAFISRLNPNLSSLSASRFIGAAVGAEGSAIAVDSSGTTIYVTGIAGSSGTPPFPVTSGAYPHQGGNNDAFLTILDSSLAITASTCLGGIGSDGGNALAVDGSGNIYVTGYTNSLNFPITAGAYDQDPNGSTDVFITRLTSDLTFMAPGPYYVDSLNGNDANNGTSAANAWQTLHHAVSEINNGSPGDYTLNVLAGTYSWFGLETDAPINIGRTGSNIHVLGDPLGTSVIGLEVDSNWPAAFSIYTSGVTIENLTIANGYQGIYIEDSSPEIRKNWIYDCGEGIYVSADQQSIAPIIWNNLIYDTTGNMLYGISLNAYAGFNPSITSTIYHNTIHGAFADGILLAENSGGGYECTVNPDVRYNIITNCAGYGVNYIVGDGTPSGVPTFAYNDVYTSIPYGGFPTGQTGSNGNISVDPVYVNPALFNFHLNTGSPCIDAIPPAAGDPVTEDLEGNARPSGTNWDMGAYEYGAAPPTQYTLTVSVSPTGGGTVTGSGINCPGDCTQDYNTGTVVTLNANPAGGWHFVDWTGNVSDPNSTTTTVTMNTDQDVTANFDLNSIADTPVAVYPLDNQVLGPVTDVTLQTSPFSDPEGDLHLWSHWRTKWAGSVYGRIPPYDPSFDQVTPGNTSHTVYGLESNMKYTWKVGYVDSGSGVTSWSAEYDFIVGTSSVTDVSVPSGTEQREYTMISFTQFPDQSAVTETMPSAGDPNYVRFGSWDPNNGGYIPWGNNLFLEPGRAYWVLAKNGLNFGLSGVTASTSHDLEIPLGYNPITGSAWNMIAPPNNKSYLWDDVEVVVYDPDTGVELFGPMPISDPSVATYIDQRIWMWNSGSYVEYNPGDGFILNPGEGYWVLSQAPNVYLRFPVTAQQPFAALSTTPKTMFAKIYKQGKEWIKKGLFSPRSATADAGDSPPMPMADFNEPLTSDAPGCFVGATGLRIRE